MRNIFGAPAAGTGASQPSIFESIKTTAGTTVSGFGTGFGGTSAAAPKSNGFGTGTFGAIPAATPSGGLFAKSTAETTRKGELPSPFPFEPLIEKDPSAINITNVYQSIHAGQCPEISFEVRWIPSFDIHC